MLMVQVWDKRVLHEIILFIVGDSFVGGLVWALSKGKAIKEAIKAGQICSGLTLASKDNISSEITEEKILKELENTGNKNKSK